MGFDFYARQDLKGPDETIELVLHELVGPNGKAPVLDVVYAGGDNDGWQAATMLDADELDGMFGVVVAGVEVSAAERQRRSKEVERRLRMRLANHVVKNLRDAVRDDGTAADASDAADFLLKIPMFVVLRVLHAVADPRRFQNRPTPPARPAAEIAGK